jgi:hypothetical protein
MVDDGFLIGFEDSSGNFVEVGRFNNTASDVTQPLEIKHANSGERITLDSSGFKTSGDISVGGSVQSTDELNFRSLTSDPASPNTGDMWYRSDIDVFRLQTISGVQSLTTTDQTNLIPESVVHQYRGDNFESTGWVDSVGESDLSVNGPNKSTIGNPASASAISDGVDDFALADKNGPETLPSNPRFSVAFTINSTDKANNSRFFEATDGTDIFRLIDGGGNGEPRLAIRDSNGATLLTRLDFNICDGVGHLVVINVDPSLGASGIDYYVDDMATAKPETVLSNGSFNNSAYDNSSALGVFCRNSSGVQDQFKSFNTSLIEFNEGLYDLQDRENIIARQSVV